MDKKGGTYIQWNISFTTQIEVIMLREMTQYRKTSTA
jgi:hypothetical protein